MNKLKRLAALALSLAMVFTMGMGVAAAADSPDFTVTLTDGITDAVAEPVSAVVGETISFNVGTVPDTHSDQNVIGESSVTSGGTPSVDMEYYEINDGTYHPLTGNQFGPSSGFPLIETSSSFRATFTAAGTYTFKIDIKTVSDKAVIASTTFTVNVTEPAYEAEIVGDKKYKTLEEAVAAANVSGGEIDLLTNVTCENMISITHSDVTIDGNGHTLTANVSGVDLDTKAISFTANNGTVRNLVINAGDECNYGVQFFNCTNGSANNVTVNGANWYGVQLNSAEASVTNCTINGSKYGGIEYAIGSDTSLRIPKLTSVDGTRSDSPLVVMDKDTVERIAGKLGVANDPATVLEKLKADNATNNYLPGPVLESMTVNEDNGIGAPANGSSTNTTYTPSKKRYTELPRNWWPEIEKIQKAEAGETVEIELRGDKVSAQVIDEAAGKDVNLAVNHLWNIYTVNGKDLKSDPARVYYTAADFIKEITAVEHTVTPVEE